MGKRSGGAHRPLLGILVGAAGAVAVGRAVRRYRYDVLMMLRTLTGGKRNGTRRRTDGTAG